MIRKVKKLGLNGIGEFANEEKFIISNFCGFSNEIKQNLIKQNYLNIESISRDKFGQTVIKVLEENIHKKIVLEVEWEDAQSGYERWDVSDLVKDIKPLITKSIGYLIFEDKKYIILGFMMFGDDVVKHFQLIPKKMVINTNVLCRFIK